MKTDAEIAIAKLEARVAVLESCIPYIPTPIAKAEPIDGKQLRKTCLHDNGDGSFSLTLLVDVRGDDVVEAADLLKRGRALQAAADYKDAPGDEPVQMSVNPRTVLVSDPVTCARCGKSGAMNVSRIALTHQAGAGLKPVVTAYCADCAMVEP